MPAGAGTPRYENWMHWLMEGFMPRTPPLAGDKPQRYIPHSTLGCRCWVTVVGVAGRRRGSFIPDRSPGHAFVPIVHAGGCRHTKV